MATAGKKKTEEVSEKEIDFMADAPKERPYHEAVSETHRELLNEHGIQVPEASPAA